MTCFVRTIGHATVSASTFVVVIGSPRASVSSSSYSTSYSYRSPSSASVDSWRTVHRGCHRVSSSLWSTQDARPDSSRIQRRHTVRTVSVVSERTSGPYRIRRGQRRTPRFPAAGSSWPSVSGIRTRDYMRLPERSSQVACSESSSRPRIQSEDLKRGSSSPNSSLYVPFIRGGWRIQTNDGLIFLPKKAVNSFHSPVMQNTG